MRIAYLRDALHVQVSVYHDAVSRVSVRGKDFFAVGGEEECCYLDGQARYELVAKTSAFHDGIMRVLKGVKKYRLALMCAEKDPITCHRTILVCRHLRGKGFSIQHILSDGKLESHEELEERMLEMLGKSQPSLFASREQLVEQAYEEQGGKIAYRQSPDTPEEELNATRIP